MESETPQSDKKVAMASYSHGGLTAYPTDTSSPARPIYDQINHVHIHLIPRYNGDQEDPRGGVRLIFPDKANYWGP